MVLANVRTGMWKVCSGCGWGKSHLPNTHLLIDVVEEQGFCRAEVSFSNFQNHASCSLQLPLYLTGSIARYVFSSGVPCSAMPNCFCSKLWVWWNMAVDCWDYLYDFVKCTVLYNETSGQRKQCLKRWGVRQCKLVQWLLRDTEQTQSCFIDFFYRGNKHAIPCRKTKSSPKVNLFQGTEILSYLPLGKKIRKAF